ncbi:RadC family protein [Thiomicrorhabdus indica]|uniref:RadC family protein n=1 Tax=Thiomicrorhabdus indica TaxID=2267253 RepID=UPI002AA72560|nr:DNA repair protein RadC [Thiomicrorhabdus indica]
MLPSPFKAGDKAGYYKTEELLDNEAIFKMANYLARQQLKKGRAISSPSDCFAALQTLLQTLEHEVFGLVYLDQQHCIINHEILFRGTINQASVYPRELIKSALSHNAAAVILFHNHPSGCTKPSNADDQLTEQIKTAFEHIEIRVVDHVIVGHSDLFSYAQSGKI